MKIYISLPITGHDIEQVEARSIFTAAMLREQGHTPISPMKPSSVPTSPLCSVAMPSTFVRTGKPPAAAASNTKPQKSTEKK